CAAILRRSVELAALQDQVADRELPVAAAGEGVEQLVVPGAVHGRELEDRSRAVVAVAMRRAEEIACVVEQQIAEASRDAPPRHAGEHGELQASILELEDGAAAGRAALRRGAVEIAGR